MDKRFKDFEKYYCIQAGGGDDYNVFKGSRYMKGHGFLGRIMGKVGRPLWNLVGKHLLSAGLNVADDVISKKRKFKDAFGVHGRAAGRHALTDTSALLSKSMANMDNMNELEEMDHLQTGSGKRRVGRPKKRPKQKRTTAVKKNNNKGKKNSKGKKNPNKKSVALKTPKRKVKKRQKQENLDFFNNL